MADKVKVRVTGMLAVCGVYAPGTLEMDPDEFDIELLVRTKYVERVKVTPAAPPKEDPPESGPADEPPAGKRGSRG